MIPDQHRISLVQEAGVLLDHRYSKKKRRIDDLYIFLLLTPSCTGDPVIRQKTQNGEQCPEPGLHTSATRAVE